MCPKLIVPLQIDRAKFTTVFTPMVMLPAEHGGGGASTQTQCAGRTRRGAPSGPGALGRLTGAVPVLEVRRQPMLQ